MPLIKKINRVDSLASLSDPKFIKTLSLGALKQLCALLREEIINVCSTNGGHLASNLGVVELTVALFSYFNFPKDKIIFDVGHQCYSYKILSGRNLASLRKENGIDGFPKRKESIYDCYETGHSSTSISAAMGMALTRDLNHENYEVIALIGDSSLANGLPFEALNLLSNFKHRLLIIINDNEMSITRPVGQFHKALSHIKNGHGYVNGKDAYKALMYKNVFTRQIYKVTSKIKDFFASHLYQNNVFEDMGILYYGVVDGHDIEELHRAFLFTRQINKPIIIHVSTKKGKGYEYAENDKEGKFHGIAPFDIETGKLKKRPPLDKISWSALYSLFLHDEMKDNKKVVCIYPATGYGSCLTKIQKDFPNRCFDVGINEEHAAIFSSGIAINGYKPYLTVYSTFLQRSYDEIHHDIARQDLPVTMFIDRCGLVGDDGETHQGIYDVAYLYSIPNVAIAMAKNKEEAASLFNFSLSYPHPLAIRFPKGVTENYYVASKKLKLGEWQLLLSGHKKVVISYGPKVELLNEKLEGSDFDLVNAIFLRPILDTNIKKLLSYETILIYDPYSTENGFASILKSKLVDASYQGKVKTIALPNEFIQKGSVEEQEKRCLVDLDTLLNTIQEL